MNSKEILLIRYRKSLRAGIFDAESGGKLKVSLEKGRSVSVPRSNLLLETGRRAENQGQLDAFMREVEALADDMDLQELWELVSDDGEALEAPDLAEFFFASEPDVLQRAALLWRLNSEDCPFFDVDEETYRPAREKAIEEQRQRREKHQRDEQEERAFIDWIRGEESELNPDSMTAKQRAWFEKIRRFILEGEDVAQFAKIKSFLSQASLRGDLRRALFNVFVDKKLFEADEHLDLLRLDVPTAFGDEIEAAASAYDPASAFDSASAYDPASAGQEQRRDLSQLQVFSVDDASTTDIDDAFSMVATDSGYQLGIHITDLSVAVPTGSALDDAATERITTHYFPDRKLPMLPASLSEGTGSLIADQERPAVTALIDIDSNYEIRGVEFMASRIVSRHRLDYDQVDRITENEEDHPLAEEIRALDAFAAKLLEARIERGAVEFERSDLSISISEGREIHVELRPTNSTGQRIVSELMILYNVEAAKFCHANAIPVIFRAQIASQPDLSGHPEPLHPALKRHLYLKAAAPPDLTLEAKPHQMLGVELYCQISSPLRRYVDLLHQRQLASFLRGDAPLDADALRQILFQTEEHLRELRRLEAGRNRYWLLHYIKNLDRDTFEAVVLDAGDRQAQIEVSEFSLRAGMNLDRPVEPGEIVVACLTRADPWDGTVRFRLA